MIYAAFKGITVCFIVFFWIFLSIFSVSYVGVLNAIQTVKLSVNIRMANQGLIIPSLFRILLLFLSVKKPISCNVCNIFHIRFA